VIKIKIGDGWHYARPGTGVSLINLNNSTSLIEEQPYFAPSQVGKTQVVYLKDIKPAATRGGMLGLYM